MSKLLAHDHDHNQEYKQEESSVEEYYDNIVVCDVKYLHKYNYVTVVRHCWKNRMLYKLIQFFVNT